MRPEGSPGSVIGDKLIVQTTEYKVVAIVPYINVFIPEPDAGKKFNGCSLLFGVGYDTYMYVGVFVAKFKPLNPIIGFESPVECCDASAAYAVDREGYIYLMNLNPSTDQGVVFQINEDLLEEVSDQDNPYSYFFTFHNKYPELFSEFPFVIIVNERVFD